MKKLKSILQALKNKWLYKLFVSLLAGLVFCLYTFGHSGTSAVTYLSLNYPQALEGQYLNGTRLNMYDVLSDEILERAIEKAGLQNVMTAGRLGEMITVSPRHSSKPEDKYIATEFELDLFMQDRIEGVDANGLLQMVCMAFVETFYGAHSYNQALVQFSLSNLDELDYNEISLMFKTKIDLMANYVNYRYANAPDFVSTETGESFSGLRQQISDFSNVVLEKYSSYVLDNGITKDRSKLQASLDYEQILLKKDYDKFMLEYDVRIDAINSYDTIQSAIVMIPTTDDAGEFYMSKTKTGVDYLAEQANYGMTQAKTIKRRIDSNASRLAIEQTKAALALTEPTARIDQMIDEILASISSLEQRVMKTDDDYIRKETAKSLVYRMRIPSDTELYDFKMTALVILGSFLLLTALGWWTDKRSSTRRRKGGLRYA